MGSDADAKNRSAKGQIDGPEIQNAQQGNPQFAYVSRSKKYAV